MIVTVTEPLAKLVDHHQVYARIKHEVDVKIGDAVLKARIPDALWDHLEAYRKGLADGTVLPETRAVRLEIKIEGAGPHPKMFLAARVFSASILTWDQVWP